MIKAWWELRGGGRMKRKRNVRMFCKDMGMGLFLYFLGASPKFLSLTRSLYGRRTERGKK